MSGAVAGGLILAAVCALGTNVGWLIKHRGVQHSPRMSHRHPWQSVRALFNSRAFVIGLAIATGAGLLHIVALAFAPISIVQAVMAGGVVILAVLAEPISGWRVTPRQWTGVMFTAGGLIILALALPTIHGAHNAYSTPTMVVFELVTGMLGGLLLPARDQPTHSTRRRADRRRLGRLLRRRRSRRQSPPRRRRAWAARGAAQPMATPGPDRGPRRATRLHPIPADRRRRIGDRHDRPYRQRPEHRRRNPHLRRPIRELASRGPGRSNGVLSDLRSHVPHPGPRAWRPLTPAPR